MCYAVYMGTDVELKTSKFDEKNPGFYVEDINDNKDIKVKEQFSKKYVYYLGSHDGCGCGFSYDEDEADVVEDLEASKRDVLKFNELLQYVLENSKECEIFLCWEGDQGVKPERTETVGLEVFSKGDWVEDKPTLYKVKKELSK